MKNGAARGLVTGLIFFAGACAYDEGLQVEDFGPTAPAALLAPGNPALRLKLDGALESAFFASSPDTSAREVTSLPLHCQKVRAMGRSIEHLPDGRRLVFQHADGQVSAMGVRCLEERQPRARRQWH